MLATRHVSDGGFRGRSVRLGAPSHSPHLPEDAELRKTRTWEDQMEVPNGHDLPKRSKTLRQQQHRKRPEPKSVEYCTPELLTIQNVFYLIRQEQPMHKFNFTGMTLYCCGHTQPMIQLLTPPTGIIVGITVGGFVGVVAGAQYNEQD